MRLQTASSLCGPTGVWGRRPNRPQGFGGSNSVQEQDSERHRVLVSDRRGQPTIRDVDLEMVVKRIAGAVVYVFNLTRFIFFPGWNFTKV